MIRRCLHTLFPVLPDWHDARAGVYAGPGKAAIVSLLGRSGAI
jgi:hypothetical protein